MTKINIQFEFKDGPWGGGNQFLKALKNEFQTMNVYASAPEDADCILFNSHHLLNRVLEIKRRYPGKLFAHRIDGPVSLIRNRDFYIDKNLFKFNHAIADVSIFQSKWSREECIKLGYTPNKFEGVVYNAPDANIFHDRVNSAEISGKKAIVATSWSNNLRKGFELYKYLDDHLDFSKYSFSFIGNSPIKFNRITHFPPVPSKELAGQLRRHDIYITASMRDPCSNSLIEALNCGLPAVVLEDGGHPELIGGGGVCFNTNHEAIIGIDQVAANLSRYQSLIPKRSIRNAANQYLKLVSDAIFVRKNEHTAPKKPNIKDVISIKFGNWIKPYW